MKCFAYLFLGLFVFSPGILVAESGASPQPSAPTPPTNRPNVLIILTDDQGYGDMGAHGHPFLKTPNMDKMHAESVRFTDFHVAPMCSPTRGELMTGVDAMKTAAPS